MGFVKVVVVLQLSLLFVASFTAEADQLISALPPHAPAHPPLPHHHHHHHHPPAEAPSHHHGHHGHPPAYPPSHGPHPPPKPLPPKPAPPVHPPKPPVHSVPPLHPPKPLPPVHPPKPLPPKPAPGPVHPPKPLPPLPPKPLPPKPAPGPAHPPIQHPPFPRTLVAVQGVVYCKSCKYPGVDTLNGASPILGATVKLQCNNTKYPQEVTAKTDKNGYFFLEAPKTITNYGFHKCKVLLGPSPLPKCSKPSTLHGGASGAELKPEKSYIGRNKLPFVLFTVGPLAYEPECH